MPYLGIIGSLLGFVCGVFSLCHTLREKQRVEQQEQTAKAWKGMGPIGVVGMPYDDPRLHVTEEETPTELSSLTGLLKALLLLRRDPEEGVVIPSIPPSGSDEWSWG